MTGRNGSVGQARQEVKKKLHPHAKDSRAATSARGTSRSRTSLSLDEDELHNSPPPPSSATKHKFNAPTLPDDLTDSPKKAFKAAILPSPVSSQSPKKKPGFNDPRTLFDDGDDGHGETIVSRAHNTSKKYKTNGSPTATSKKFHSSDVHLCEGAYISFSDSDNDIKSTNIQPSNLGKSRINNVSVKKKQNIPDKNICLRTTQTTKGTGANITREKSRPEESSQSARTALRDASQSGKELRSSQIGSHLEHSQFVGSSQVGPKKKTAYGAKAKPGGFNFVKPLNPVKKTTGKTAADDALCSSLKSSQMEDEDEQIQQPKKLKLFHIDDLDNDDDLDSLKPPLSSIDSDSPLFSSSGLHKPSDSQSSILDMTAAIEGSVQQPGMSRASSPTVTIDSDDEDASSSQSTKCPVCGERVSKQLLASYSAGKSRMNMSEQVRFCRHHKRQTAIASYDAATYPKIDWTTLNARVSSHHGVITSILDHTCESYYRNVLSEAIQSGKSSRTVRQEIFSGKDDAGGEAGQSLTPGYYGSRGLRVISENLMAQFSPRLRRLAVKDKLILASGGVGSYVQRVLVPEVAVRLIAEDMNVDMEQARKVMRDSIAIGEALNEEIAEIIVRREGEDYDGEMSNGYAD